ncbi:MAG TPA: hypothetical protein VH392_01475 [Sphingomicrobium sp.]
MANYKKIAELRPDIADFFGNRRLIAFRGDVLSYFANVKADTFSTDAAGFRHSTFDGREYSVADCVRSGRYGIVLGASNLFGFGVAGNENTVPSLLAERLGFPFANATMPGGNTRNLQALLVGLVAGASKLPAVVALSSGGELVNFCESSIADPIFGSPNRSQLKSLKEQGVKPDPEKNFPRMLAFHTLWTSALATLCRAYGSKLVLIHQSTFFEKAHPTQLELDSEIGIPFNPSQEMQFANHRKFNQPFYAKRKAVADKLGVPLAGWGLTEEITFMDEFHGDREGTRVIAQAVGDAIEPLLANNKAPEPAPAA